MEGYGYSADEYCAPEPYPPVQAVGKNRRYAEAMLDNVGGGNSEMSAVAVYVYDHLVTAELPEVADAFRGIGAVEMRHLEIFGTLARQMGEDPRLWGSGQGGRKSWWSPGYSQYVQRLGPLIRGAVKVEKAAIRKYKAQLRWIADPNIQENLRRIIADEEHHLKILARLYDTHVGRMEPYPGSI